MATLKTQGFQLSALPRAPNIPGNVGMVDIKAIDDGVRRGLANFEAIRQAPKSMMLADAQADAQTAQAPLKTRGLLAQTEASEQQLPIRTGLLADQATVSAAQTPVVAASAENVKNAQAMSAQQFADFSDAYANAQGLADYSMKAQELEALPVKFPWLTQVPEYKTLLTRIADSTNAARTAAAQQGQQASALELAKTKVAGTRTPDQRLLEDLARMKQELQENPDDPYLPERIDQTQQLLNKKQSVGAADPSAQRDLQRELTERRLQPVERRLEMENKKRETAAHNAMVAAEVNANDVNDYVDLALKKVGPLSVGLGATLLSKIGGQDGADLRNLASTLSSTVALQTLTTLRSLSASGGGLGNVSNADIELLKNRFGSLSQDQSVAQFKANLENIRKEMNDVATRAKQSYQRQFAQPDVQSAPSTAGGAIDDLLKKYQ